jgi:LysM repeat protein
MDWKSDSDERSYEEVPYTTLSGSKRGGILSRREFPFILLGAGLLLLLLLFLIFAPGSHQASIDRLSGVPQRLDQMENRLKAVEDMETRLDRLEAQIMSLGKTLAAEKSRNSPDPQLVDRVQESSASIQKFENRINLLERRLNRMKNEMQVAAKAPSKPAPVRKKPEAEASKAPSKRIHVVKEGETLYRIAVNRKVDLEKFLELNGLEEGAVIYPGQKLKIPGDG